MCHKQKGGPLKTGEESLQNNLPGIELRENSFNSQHNVPSVTCSPVSTDKPGEQQYENVAPWLDNSCGGKEVAWGFDDEKTQTPLQGDRYTKFPEDSTYENVERVEIGHDLFSSSSRRKGEEDENRYTEMPGRETYVNFPTKPAK